ncbi:hypothetical protein [Streptomyces sp. NPDC051546]|uniref:hypothetical protein n=1 Tax=Streptomyces sp. NPDC051546 TaxID=3365655 RepID=UPI003799A71C
MAMLPVAQLYARDVPDLHTPADMEPQTYCDCVLSAAPGGKVGGRPSWGPIDPGPRPCPA